jgi:hypothetical protein
MDQESIPRCCDVANSRTTLKVPPHTGVHIKQRASGWTGIPVFKRFMPRKILRWAANLLLAGLIVGSFLPSKEKVRLGTQHHRKGQSASVDAKHRLYHLGSFGLTTLAFLLLARGIHSEIKCATWMMALGCLIESTQCLMAQPHLVEWWDIRDDFYAIAGTFLLVQIANAASRHTPAVSVSTDPN